MCVWEFPAEFGELYVCLRIPSWIRWVWEHFLVNWFFCLVSLVLFLFRFEFLCVTLIAWNLLYRLDWLQRTQTSTCPCLLSSGMPGLKACTTTTHLEGSNILKKMFLNIKSRVNPIALGKGFWFSLTWRRLSAIYLPAHAHIHMYKYTH